MAIDAARVGLLVCDVWHGALRFPSAGAKGVFGSGREGGLLTISGLGTRASSSRRSWCGGEGFLSGTGVLEGGKRLQNSLILEEGGRRVRFDGVWSVERL